MNLIRIGFIPTNGLDLESHQCVAKDENLLTSFGLELECNVDPSLFMSVLLVISIELLLSGARVAKHDADSDTPSGVDTDGRVGHLPPMTSAIEVLHLLRCTRPQARA